MIEATKYNLLWCLLLVGNNVWSQAIKPLFTFGVIADVQYADRDNHLTRHYRSSLHKLDQAVEVFNKEKVRFVMSLGDFINDDFKSFDTLNAITRKLNMPLHHVIGNHDYEVDDEKKSKVLAVMKLKKDYYAFLKKNWKFIVLNGNDISMMSNTVGSPKYDSAKQIFDQLKLAGVPSGKPWNGTLSTGQLNWMKKELANALKKNQQVILLCHFPLYPDQSPHILWNTTEIRETIEAFPNVKAYLNGHVHASQYFLQNGVNYVTFKGMVEKDENAFAIISVFKDHLEIKGYGKEVDRVLK
ncbi:MAG: metallophosphoesterase [Chitinophagaceae bacterium]